MHGAPSVSYPVGRPRLAGLLAAGIWIGGGAVTVLWLHQASTPDWRQAVAALTLFVSGAWALLSWLRSPMGEVLWDGTSWKAPSGTSMTSLDVALDLQSVLLVRWMEERSANWLWLERRRCPHRWLELRRAVYSPATPPALPPSRPPVATP